MNRLTALGHVLDMAEDNAIRAEMLDDDPDLKEMFDVQQEACQLVLAMLNEALEADNDPVRYAKMLVESLKERSPNAMLVLEVSTGNISEATSKWLAVKAADPAACIQPHSTWGWWVIVDDETYDLNPEAAESWPDDLRVVTAYARERGFRWVLFDQDAGLCADLPAFDW